LEQHKKPNQQTTTSIGLQPCRTRVQRNKASGPRGRGRSHARRTLNNHVCFVLVPRSSAAQKLQPTREGKGETRSRPRVFDAVQDPVSLAPPVTRVHRLQVPATVGLRRAERTHCRPQMFPPGRARRETAREKETQLCVRGAGELLRQEVATGCFF